MGSITAPRPSYVPKLPAGVVDKRVLSDAQLETLIYAGDAFERDISGLFKAAEEGLSLAPDQDGRPYRTGFFLGDGTGAGKGRQVAAIILDQWLRSEEHTSELQSLMRISYAVFCLKKKTQPMVDRYSVEL